MAGHKSHHICLFLQLRDEIIELVELRGIKRALVFLEDAPRRDTGVHVMKPDAIDSELRHARGDFFRVGVFGKRAAETNVHAEKPDPFVAGEEMSVARGDKSVRARRFVERAADVGDAGAGVVPRQHERK